MEAGAIETFHVVDEKTPGFAESSIVVGYWY